MQATFALAVVCATYLLGGVAGAQTQTAPPSVTVAGFQLLLSSEKSAYGLGDDPQITVSFRNESKHDAIFGPFVYSNLELIGADGVPVKGKIFPTRIWHFSGPAERVYVTVKAGTSLPDFQGLLSNWGHKIVAPGTYLVRMTTYMNIDSKVDLTGGGARLVRGHLARVISNDLTIVFQ
jgi:hypothetical protein